MFKGFGTNSPHWNGKHRRGQTLTWLPQPCPAPITSSRSPVLANIALPWQPFHPQDPPHSKIIREIICTHVHPASVRTSWPQMKRAGLLCETSETKNNRQALEPKEAAIKTKRALALARSCVLRLEVLSGAYSRETWRFPGSLVTVWKETNQL